MRELYGLSDNADLPVELDLDEISSLDTADKTHFLKVCCCASYRWWCLQCSFIAEHARLRPEARGCLSPCSFVFHFRILIWVCMQVAFFVKALIKKLEQSPL